MGHAKEAVRYLESGAAWREFHRAAERIATSSCVRVCDVGGGANPVLGLDLIEQHQLEYVLVDVSASELAKAPAEYVKVVADATSARFLEGASYDLVVSKFVAEHIRDPARFHRNLFAILARGGFALHYFPTLFALPFVLNLLGPEWLGERSLIRIHPSRTPEGHTAKFPALYRWCRGPSDRQLARLRSTGFDVVDYIGGMGHDYYRTSALVSHLEAAKTEWLLRHPVPALTSYACVLLRKPG